MLISVIKFFVWKGVYYVDFVVYVDFDGVSEEHLIDNWGMPDSSFMVDADTKVITYVEYSQEGDADAYSDEVYYNAISGPDFVGPDADDNGVEYCKISFVITDNVVTNYNYNGDYCIGNIMGNNNR